MANHFRGILRIPNYQQCNEDYGHSSLSESGSFDSSHDGYEGFSSSEELSEDLEESYIKKKQIMKLKNNVCRCDRNHQCIWLKLPETQARVQRLTDISDQLLESEQAKSRKLRHEIIYLTSELERQEEKSERTISKLKTQIKEKDKQVDNLHDLLDKTYSELKKVKSDVQLCQHEWNACTPMPTIFYRDIDMRFLQATIDNLKHELQEAHIEKKILVETSFEQTYQLQGAKSHIKELQNEIAKTKRERDSVIQVKIELEVQALNDEFRIRSLEKEIKDINISNRGVIELLKKKLDHLKLHSYKTKMPKETEKQERRRINDNEEREEKPKKTNSQKQKSMKSLNGYNSRVGQKISKDQNKQDIITQEHDINEKQMKLREEQIIISNLKREIEKRDQTLNVLKESFKNSKNIIKSVDDPNKIIKEMKERLSEQGKQLKEALSQLREKEATLASMKREMELERQTKLNLEKQTRENIETIKGLTLENNNIIQRNKVLECNVKQRNIEIKEFGKRTNLDATYMQKMEERLAEQGKQLKEALSQLREKEETLASMKHEMEFERQTKVNLEKQSRENIETIKELTSENNKMNQRKQALENDVKQRNIEIKEFGKQTKVDATSMQEMEERLAAQGKQLKGTLSKLREKEETLASMKREMELERQTKLNLEKQSRENIETIKELTSENDKLNQRKKALENDVKQRSLQMKAFEKAKVDAISMQDEMGKIVREKDSQIAYLEDKIHRSFAKLKDTETELEQTKTRLSKALGDRLKDNNPNIADLSDENRPVKLAERYSELYDNQWTDAFDFLSKSLDSERSTIEALLEILQDVTYFCIASASKQLDDLQGILVFSNTSVGDIPVDVRLHLKNFRKALSKTAMRNLFESYISHMKQTAPDKLRRAPEVRPYVQECFEICWLMSIQDPPVVFAPVAKQGSILDTNIYKPYTRSGTHVEYTVWPAMLLHEKGPILLKGVAQGQKQSG